MKITDLKNKIVVLSTSDKECKPHSVLAEVNKADKNGIIITDNYMKNTISNIKSNPYVSLIFWDGKEGLRIDGKAEYHNSGKHLEFVKSLKENKEYPAKGTIIIKVEEIKELR